MDKTSLQCQRRRTSFTRAENVHACSIMSDSCNTMDYSPPGSSVHGISQARILEWLAVSYSRGSSCPRDQTHISCTPLHCRCILYHCTTWETHREWEKILKDWNWKRLKYAVTVQDEFRTGLPQKFHTPGSRGWLRSKEVWPPFTSHTKALKVCAWVRKTKEHHAWHLRRKGSLDSLKDEVLAHSIRQYF